MMQSLSTKGLAMTLSCFPGSISILYEFFLLIRALSFDCQSISLYMSENCIQKHWQQSWNNMEVAIVGLYHSLCSTMLDLAFGNYDFIPHSLMINKFKEFNFCHQWHNAVGCPGTPRCCYSWVRVS